MLIFKLHAIVAVDPSERVLCQQPGCGHTVYARIHVVEADGQLLVLGSDCFARRYGNALPASEGPFASGVPKVLTQAEREMLQNNTAALLAQFEAEHQQQIEQRRALQEAYLQSMQKAIIPRRKPPVIHVPAQMHWAKPMSSVAYFHWGENSGWLRVQHKDGRQFLLQFPLEEGWDEALPASIGRVNEELCGYEVRDLVSAVQFLRSHSIWEKVGSWRDVHEARAKANTSSGSPISVGFQVPKT